ncbi:MAG: LytR family transcriptional regulator [Spirochaetaceae bacterium]|nr:MAG: LytR family transcriptional regulator [Spirochaetaceae bacterium]
MKRKKEFDRAIIFLALIVLIVSVTVAVVHVQVRSNVVSEIVKSGAEITLLVVVEDQGAPLFTQVFLYNPVTRRGAFFDVPGDVGSILGSLNRVDRIDAVYREAGVDVYRRTIERLLGIDVPFHMVATVDGIGQLVDLSEGVRLFLDAGIIPDDGEPQLRLPAGNVMLDGHNAATYLLRYADAAGEGGRVSRNQYFLQSLFERLGERSGYLNHNRVAGYVMSAVDTNLDRRAFSRLLEEFAVLDTEQLVYRRVQGNYRRVETDGHLQELLFPHFEGQWLRQTVRQVRDSLASETDAFEDNAAISLEILNGTPINGLARRTRDLLEGYGFNVVRIGNAETSDVEYTLIVDRLGNARYAERVAGILQGQRVYTDTSDIESVDAFVTVILGKDFDGTVVRP